MRIISGNLKGSKLYMTKYKTTRPLKDLAKESIFNMLIHSNKILFQFEKSTVLDLYAGTGSFGLECLSREAQFVYFVESEKNAFSVLKKNINKFKIGKKVKIFHNDIFLLMKKNIFEKKFDLIFCDPPFEDKKILELIELIFKKNLLNKNGILILHRNKNTKNELPDYFKILDQRLYGKSKITFGKFLS